MGGVSHREQYKEHQSLDEVWIYCPDVLSPTHKVPWESGFNRTSTNLGLKPLTIRGHHNYYKFLQDKTSTQDFIGIFLALVHLLGQNNSHTFIILINLFHRRHFGLSEQEKHTCY